MIRLATEKDIEEILTLSSKAFGKHFHSKEHFEQTLTNETSIFVNDKGKISAYCIILKEDNQVRIDSITVDENERGKGIASMLIEDVILNYGHLRIYTYAWKMKNGEVNLKVILERLGFKFVEEIKNMWYEDSKKTGFICPSCGNPCICSALVYELTN